MDTDRILKQLYLEARHIDQAIMALEQLVKEGGKRRGRPPKWLSQPVKEPENATDPSRPQS
jgi:hypothetical protein